MRLARIANFVTWIYLFCVHSAFAQLPPHGDLSFFISADGAKAPIQSTADWELRRASVIHSLEQVMGPLPKPETPVPLDVQFEELSLGENYNRHKIKYHTDSIDEWVHAYLFIPIRVVGKSPAVLCLHQTTNIGKEEPAGLGGRETLHYALELAKRGYVTLAPDYPSFGEYSFDFHAAGVPRAGEEAGANSKSPRAVRYQSGSMKAIYDNIRAVDLLQAMEEVDGEKIACIGHSLGGHNAIFTTVFEPRIGAVATSCGFTRFHKYYGGKLKGWTSDRYMPLIERDFASDPDRVPFDFPELVAAIAPRRFFTSSPLHDDNFEVSGVRETIEAAKPVYRLYGSESHLVAIYPDCPHEFPDEARAKAYEFLENWAKPVFREVKRQR